MAVVSFAAMYGLMYLMVDTFGNVYANRDQFYMVAAMTAAMVLIEVTIMGPMYAKKSRRTAVGASVVVLIASVILIRGQFGISDREFLKAMIPHHGAALLMCKNAGLKDPEVIKLCQDITASQQSQIDWMRTKLSTLK